MRTFTAAAFCCGLLLSTAAGASREVSGVRMPEAIDLAGKELRLNGMGLRKRKVFFKVYVAGLYLERPTSDARQAIASDTVKTMVLVVKRDVSCKQLAEAVEGGIRRNSAAEMPSLRQRLDALKRELPDLKKGSAIDFTYLPGVGTVVRGEGRQMIFRGKDFADALFSVWLGSNPTSGKLKRQLLGG